MARDPLTVDGVTATEFRVRYAETDQMGVAHHANHLVWCEQARTDHMRGLGASYREIEGQGLMLPVIDARVRYRAPARYEDLIRVRCWVREITRRQVIFGYVVERADDSAVLATAQTALVAVDSNRRLATIPEHIRRKLVPVADPVRI
jgi:acyl-CoA thioester hydrolase